MAVRYVRWGSGTVRVSKRWHVVLAAARKDGVVFTLNSGHRTLREQLALFRRNMQRVGLHWAPRPGHPLTAFPTPLAPHIRTGRPDHALDVQQPGVDSLVHWLRVGGRKAHVRFTVPGEGWHIEINADDLTRLWRTYR
jgi:hypothetical protein